MLTRHVAEIRKQLTNLKEEPSEGAEEEVTSQTRTPDQISASMEAPEKDSGSFADGLFSAIFSPSRQKTQTLTQKV